MRIIAKLDIKQSYLIKSIRYDGVRKIGDLKNYLKQTYYTINVFFRQDFKILKYDTFV